MFDISKNRTWEQVKELLKKDDRVMAIREAWDREQNGPDNPYPNVFLEEIGTPSMHTIFSIIFRKYVCIKNSTISLVITYNGDDYTVREAENSLTKEDYMASDWVVLGYGLNNND